MKQYIKNQVYTKQQKTKDILNRTLEKLFKNCGIRKNNKENVIVSSNTFLTNILVGLSPNIMRTMVSLLIVQNAVKRHHQHQAKDDPHTDNRLSQVSRSEPISFGKPPLYWSIKSALKERISSSFDSSPTK